MSGIGAYSRLCKLSSVLILTLQRRDYDLGFTDRNVMPKEPSDLPDAVQARLELKFKTRSFCSKPWLFFQQCHIDPWNRKSCRLITYAIQGLNGRQLTLCVWWENRRSTQGTVWAGGHRISLRKQDLTCTWREEIRILEKEKKGNEEDMLVLYSKVMASKHKDLRRKPPIPRDSPQDPGLQWLLWAGV